MPIVRIGNSDNCWHGLHNFPGFKNRFPKAWHGHVLGSGVIKLTANRRQFSPISLKRGRKQAKLPDPLWDEGHYRIGFRRPSQDINNSENQALSSCLKKTNSTAELKCKSSRMNNFGERITIFCPSNLHRDKAPRRRILEVNPRSRAAGAMCSAAG